MTCTATFSAEDNKIRLYASERLDPETYTRVKAAGYIWAPRQKLFVAPAWTPAREDLALELAGEIGDEDTSLAERAEERAGRFDTYADHRQSDAESAAKTADSIAGGIPFGQPILIGHHSEKRARRDAEKIQSATLKAVKMWETSAYWLQRAERAIAHAERKERPDVRIRRIKTIEADKRRQERAIAEAEKFNALWNKTEEITRERAISIANYDHVYIRKDGEPFGQNLWSLLDRGEISPEAAREKVLKARETAIAWARRWIAHYDNRLVYERAMLAASGIELPGKQKPNKSAKAALPLLNYRAEGITVQSPYRCADDLITLGLVEMTKAGYAGISADYKTTRVVNGTHRIRVRYHAGKLCAVFLTDSKVHEIPKADAAKAEA